MTLTPKYFSPNFIPPIRNSHIVITFVIISIIIDINYCLTMQMFITGFMDAIVSSRVLALYQF
jgi:hypothetical protein